jgi:hypothetical protein
MPLACSVSDCTLTITASRNDANQTHDDIFWGGSWLTYNAGFGDVVGTLLFRVVYNGDAPGLYYFPEGYAHTFYSNYSVTTVGAGTLVKSFSGSSLSATLRFRTCQDGDGNGYAEAYCDGTLVVTFTPHVAVGLTGLVSGLYINCEGWSLSSPQQSIHIGPVTGIVWNTSGGAVLVSGGAPAVIATVEHLWPDWVTYIGGGGNPASYAASLDLLANGYLYTPANLAADDGGYFYQHGSSFLDGFQIAFGLYTPASTSGAPVLSLAYHTVSGALLASDCGLAADHTIGYWKLQRGAAEDNLWSKRVSLAATGVLTAMLVSTEKATVLLEGTAMQAVLVPLNSLDGDFGTPVQMGDGLLSPYAAEVSGRYGVTSLPTVGLSYDVVAQTPPYGAVHDEVPIYTGVVQRGPVLARHPLTWRLYAAAQAGASSSLLYTSSDQGLTWQHGGTLGLYVGGSIYPVEYPALWCDRDYLWLACYRPTPTAGAPGQVCVYQLRATPERNFDGLFPDEVKFNVVQSGTILTSGSEWQCSGIVVGPSDAGRPAIIRDPLTGRLTVLAPKTTAWADEGLPTPGIVEYTSTDTGTDWTQFSHHAVS